MSEASIGLGIARATVGKLLDEHDSRGGGDDWWGGYVDALDDVLSKLMSLEEAALAKEAAFSEKETVHG